MSDIRIIDEIQSLVEKNERFVSFEFFPPKTDDGCKNLIERMDRLKQQEPIFMDMTWGAGGSTSELSLDLCIKMTRDHGIVANMHLTCTNMPEEKVDIALKGCKDTGIRNIVALRGDPPAGEEEWHAVEGGFGCALDLVKHIRKLYGYPEGHPNVIKKVEDVSKLSESEKDRMVETDDGVYVCHDEDFAKELEYLKAKVDAGADIIITQMIFDSAVYGSFVKACRAIGITCPILPGIMCVHNYGGFKRMTGFCKSRVPRAVVERLEAVKDDHDAIRQEAIAFGTQLCKELEAAGAPGFHFYTLNLEKVTNGILTNLGLNRIPEAEK